jgi:hypothetical protein
MRARITKRLVDGLKPAGTDYYVFDTDTIGFAVRVRTTGMRWGARWVGRAKGSARSQADSDGAWPVMPLSRGSGGQDGPDTPTAIFFGGGGGSLEPTPPPTALATPLRRQGWTTKTTATHRARWGRGASVVPWDETFCVSHVPAYGPKKSMNQSLN